MKRYTSSEARQKLASLLDEAERDGQVEIRRRDGSRFRIVRTKDAQRSPLEVGGVKVKMNTAEIVKIIREGRERG